MSEREEQFNENLNEFDDCWCEYSQDAITSIFVKAIKVVQNSNNPLVSNKGKPKESLSLSNSDDSFDFNGWDIQPYELSCYEDSNRDEVLFIRPKISKTGGYKNIDKSSPTKNVFSTLKKMKHSKKMSSRAILAKLFGNKTSNLYKH